MYVRLWGLWGQGTQPAIWGDGRTRPVAVIITPQPRGAVLMAHTQKSQHPLRTWYFMLCGTSHPCRNSFTRRLVSDVNVV